MNLWRDDRACCCISLTKALPEQTSKHPTKIQFLECLNNLAAGSLNGIKHLSDHMTSICLASHLGLFISAFKYDTAGTKYVFKNQARMNFISFNYPFDYLATTWNNVFQLTATWALKPTEH